MKRRFIELAKGDVRLRLAVDQYPGEGIPLLFFHGFGSSKEDYADLPLFCQASRPAFIFDAPGCGESPFPAEEVTVSLIAAAAGALVQHLEITECHLVGHSMGGLAALMFARDHPATVRSFVNIEGNLAPEDCFFSRQIDVLPHTSARDFLNKFRKGVGQRQEFSSALYGAALQCKVNPDTIPSLFRSLVIATAEADPMALFLELRCPKLFMYGSQNRGLSYLRDLAAGGIQLCEIPYSGHFPMYSNPPAMWQAMIAFWDRAEAGEAA